MKRNHLLYWLFRRIPKGLVMLVGLTCSACTIGPYDGMRVKDTNTPIALWGYVTAPRSSGAEIRVSVFNAQTNAWDVLATTATSGSLGEYPFVRTVDGVPLYPWSLGSMALANQYWQAGTDGYVAQVRTEMYGRDGFRLPLLNARKDWYACFNENVDGRAFTSGYMLRNCFSHRNAASIYTENYREGPLTCPSPSLPPAKNKHYQLEQIPDCAQEIIATHIREKINRRLIDDHYTLEHDNAAVAYSVAPVMSGGRTYALGGFFGGHENYLRKVKRHVMVYDYPWMPSGEIPSWDPATTIPAIFQFAVDSPNGNCNSRGCQGWLSGTVMRAAPSIQTPSQFLPRNVCSFSTTEHLHHEVHPWHNNVHVTVGNAFSTFDSPSFPLFFLWHTYVEDIWLDWKACEHPGP